MQILPTLIQAFKSQIHIKLNDATTNALQAVGTNSSAVATFIHPEAGFLVYNVFIMDGNNNVHKVIVDPGNGKVLSNQQMSMMEMMAIMHPGMMMMMRQGEMGIMGSGVTGHPWR